MTSITIYSASACPYAQRSRMVLLAKGIDFQLEEIDLNNKPENFQDISPYGKVPVLKHRDRRIWESAIINEYLEEVFPEPPLLPSDPQDRAMARIWIDFANTKFAPAFYKLLLTQDPKIQQEWSKELQNHLHFIEREAFKNAETGAFWLGQTLSLVDISFYPWFERWSALSHYRNIEIPPSCTRLHQWHQAMENSPIVQQTRREANFHIQQYDKYANGTASGTTAREMRRY
ncbi:glutathione S-transferase family protein [Lusitaniella coriacea]|uniref:glutathione S-transferase family protein n=1 Tax=Lusitaniella coriacea TaxID=1983105 RepID=UPI003CF50BB3